MRAKGIPWGKAKVISCMRSDVRVCNAVFLLCRSKISLTKGRLVSLIFPVAYCMKIRERSRSETSCTWDVMLDAVHSSSSQEYSFLESTLPIPV